MDKKYRAWHEELGYIFPEEYFTLREALEDQVAFWGSPTKDFDFNKIHFEESTGLKDKKRNQELYANDIVLIGRDKGVLVGDEYDYCWALQLDNGELNALCRFYTNEELEDITYLSNIHQNPELHEAKP